MAMVAVMTAGRSMSAGAPVVVVGAGPAGVRCMQELVRRAPQMPMVLYGAEAWQPYNRVRLTAALAGELGWGALGADMTLPVEARVETRFHCAVRAINRRSRTVVDGVGRVQPYSHLVLATGSRPHIPETPGIDLPGRFTFRDMNDAQQLLARRVRSRTTVVVGGGLLGLEAARAMRRFHTQVIVVEHLDRLMSRQLDTGAGALLMRHVQAEGIDVMLGDGIAQVTGRERVEGVRLRSGRELACDTLIVATGIRPNLELARDAGLAVGRGIRVDDEMRTSDPSIFAIGECVEHRGQIYGLVAPGIEQASVAAHVMAGGQARYRGTVAATRLKVLSCPVFSIGDPGNEGLTNVDSSVRYEDGARHGVYRKVVLRRGRLIGAVAVGEYDELSRVQEAVTSGRRVYPWQLARFRQHGRLWPEADAGSVTAWPATATVCNCTGVTCGALRGAIAGGCASVGDLAARTGASTVCGSCKPLLQELVGASAPREPVRAWQALTIFAAFALAVGSAMLVVPSIPYPDTADLVWRWDQLWRQGLYKQISGFSLLAFMTALGLLSLRKRWRGWLRLGDYPIWRVVHVALGVGVLAILLVHTGGRLGSGLNSALTFTALLAAAAGAGLGLVVAREHSLGVVTARRLRSATFWSHLLVMWPLPVLLTFHVLKTYYF